MKICFIYDAVYPWEKGGAQKRVRELAIRLAKDHDVHLFGMKYWDGASRMERDGVTYHGVCEPYTLYKDGRRSITQAIRFASALTEPLLQKDFDIIDCQQFPYFPIFTTKLHELLQDSKLIVTWYEVWDGYWYDYLGWLGFGGKVVERATLKLLDTIIPISESIARDLQDIGYSGELNVVENGVDFYALQKVSPVERQWDVVYFGRLSEHKRVEYLLEAVKKVSERINCELNVCIIGDGPERDDLEQFAQNIEVTDQVEFLGFIEEDEDVYANIKAASVFVLPSIREGFPNTILEANACGVPSIVVDHPENGSTAVVEDGKTGFIVPPTPDAIADKLTEVLSNEELLIHTSENAHEFGRAHDWSEIVNDIEQVYLNTVSTDSH